MDPSLISQKILILSNTGPDPPPPQKKNTKLALKVCQSPTRRGETPFSWCFTGVIWRIAGGPMMRHFDLLSPHKKKRLSEMDFLWQNLLDHHMIWI